MSAPHTVPDRDAARARARHFMLTKPTTPEQVARPTHQGSAAAQKTSGPQLLPLLTFPWQFPRDAAGLSLYFTTMASIVVLMLALSLISVVPLSENLSAANFSKRYLLVDATIPDELVDPTIQNELRSLGLPEGFATGINASATTSTSEELVLSDEVESTTSNPEIIRGIQCDQTYAGYPNIWTNMTVGHFCSNSDFSSPVECPGACIFDSAKLTDPSHHLFETCQATRGAVDPRGALWWQNGTTEEICAARMPCYDWEFNDTSLSQWVRDVSECFCCDLQLNPVRTKPIPPTQMWLWGVVMVAVYMIWLLGLRLWLVKVTRAVERAAPSGATFAVLLRGPGIVEASDAAIANFARHYGTVVQVMRPVEGGHALGLATQIQQQCLQLKELQAMAEGVQPPQPRSCFGSLPLADFAYRRLQALHQSPAAAAKSTEAAIKKARVALATAEQSPMGHATDSCIVVFNYSEHAMNAYRDLSQSSWQRLTESCSKPEGPLLADVGHTTGSVQQYPEPQNAGASGGKVVAEHAPEPSDYWWDNMRATPARAAMYSAAVWVICIIAMVVSGAIVLSLAQSSEEKRRERDYCDESTRDENGFLPSSCCTSDTLDANGNCVDTVSLTFDSGRDIATQAVSSQLSGLTITAVNSLVTTLLISITPFERRVQHSAALGSTTAKLTMFYLVNSVAIPIIAIYLSSESDESWYIPGGIAQEAFYIQLFNIFLPNIIALFNPPHPFFSQVFSHRARTQAMTDQLMHPPPFMLPLRVANIVRTVALACLYMPVLPVSVILGLFATIASYLVDHFLVFRFCAKPPEFGLAAFSVAFYFLRMLPLAWLFLMQFVFFPNDKFKGGESPQVTAPFVLGVLLWAVASLLPLQRWLGLDDRQANSSKTKGSKSFSYLSLFETATDLCSSRKLCLKETPAGDTRPDGCVTYHAVTYGPMVPPECSETFRNTVNGLYKIYKPPLPENVKLMHGQAPENGGENARPPPQDMLRAAPPKVQAMFLKPVAPQTGGAHGLHALGAPVLDTTSGFAAFTHGFV